MMFECKKVKTVKSIEVFLLQKHLIVEKSQKIVYISKKKLFLFDFFEIKRKQFTVKRL